MIEAYPLTWPVGYPRTKFPNRSRFGNHTLSASVKKVKEEIERLGGSAIIISTNIELRKSDGMPRADYAKRLVPDRGVAVYFTYKQQQRVLCCDQWDEIEDNLWAVGLSVEAMRGLDRWGVSQILERTFTGFQALPEPERMPARTCWQILGIEPTTKEDVIHTAYREKAKDLHPDRDSGSHTKFIELTEARKAAIDYAKTH